jgi:hypothetical protein
MRRVFKSLQDGDVQATEQQAGTGRKQKLTADNEGLIAAAAALNGGTSPRMALEICNRRGPTPTHQFFGHRSCCPPTFWS